MLDRPIFADRIGVALLEVGEEWHAGTGVFAATPEHLISAVAAVEDQGVRLPRIKLGHYDSRWNLPRNPDGTPQDGQPSFGRVGNMRLSPNGMVLIGDLLRLPKWLDDCLPTAYPGRSIEGAWRYKSVRGRTHPFVAQALSLLGAFMPAVTTLPDIEALFHAESIDEVKMIDTSSDAQYFFASRSEDQMPKHELVAASIGPAEIRDAYYEQLGHTTWIHKIEFSPVAQLIVEADSKALFGIPWRIEDDTVVFGEGTEVRLGYQPYDNVAASVEEVAVVYSTKEESLADTFVANAQVQTPEDGMTPEQLKALKLPEDATSEQIDERLTALAALETVEPVLQPGEEVVTPVQPDPRVAPVVPGEPSETPPVPAEKETPVEADPKVVPQGAVLVDASQWRVTQETVGKFNQMLEAQKRREHDELVSASIADGKFPPSMRSHYTDLLQKDETGTRQIIEVLAAGTVPLNEIGHGGTDAATTDVAYPSAWFPEVSKQGANA